MLSAVLAVMVVCTGTTIFMHVLISVPPQSALISPDLEKYANVVEMKGGAVEPGSIAEILQEDMNREGWSGVAIDMRPLLPFCQGFKLMIGEGNGTINSWSIPVSVKGCDGETLPFMMTLTVWEYA